MVSSSTTEWGDTKTDVKGPAHSLMSVTTIILCGMDLFYGYDKQREGFLSDVNAIYVSTWDRSRRYDTPAGCTREGGGERKLSIVGIFFFL